MTQPIPGGGVSAEAEPTVSVGTEPVTDVLANNQALIDLVAATVPDESVTPEVVSKIFAAYDQVKNGAPLDTMCRNAETGATATRISRDGIHMWSVQKNGVQSFDMRPELDSSWTTVFRPAES